MTDKSLCNLRVVGGDYFILYYTEIQPSRKKLTDFLPLFNFDNYWCFKGTNKFRQVDYQTFINFEYASYSFFRKDLYRKEHIERWCEYISSLGSIQYLTKPTPPFPPEKIIIRK